MAREENRTRAASCPGTFKSGAHLAQADGYREFRCDALGLFQRPRHAGAGNLVCLGELSETQTAISVAEQSSSINLNRLPAQHATLEPCTPQTGSDPLYNKVALQLRDRGDNDNDRPAQRSAGIEIFSKRNELDAQMVQCVQHLEKMPNASSQSVRRPHQHRVELPAMGSGEHLVECGALRIRAADPVSVFVNDFKAALSREPAQIKRLRLGILVEGGNSFCGEQLKRKSDPVHDQRRDRYHQNQKRPGKEDGAKKRPSLKHNNQTGQQDQQRHSRFASSPMCKLNGCSNTNVGIGTSAPGHLLDVAGTVAVDSTGLNNGTNFIDLTFGLNAGEGMSSSRTEGPNQYGIDLFTDFARRISIEQHGNVGIGTASPDSLLTVNGSADKPGGGSWGTFSDGRLKNLNGSYNSGLSQVLKLNPVRYRYKSDNAMGIRDTDEHIGVVAQDVQRVIPEAVTQNSKGYLLVNNDPIIWAMLNAIKEQQREFRQQQAELAKALGQIKEQQSLLRAQSVAMRSLEAEVGQTRESLWKVKAQVAASQITAVAAK